MSSTLSISRTSSADSSPTSYTAPSTPANLASSLASDTCLADPHSSPRWLCGRRQAGQICHTDVHSDQGLNENKPWTNESAIARICSLPSPPKPSHRADEDDEGDNWGRACTKRGMGAETDRSGGIPIYSPPTMFSLLGEGWTREAWQKRKIALVTGITGQGEYLLTFPQRLRDFDDTVLLSKGYSVHGIIRRSSSFNTSRLQHLYQDQHSPSKPRMILHYGDMTDSTNLVCIVSQVMPSEIYNLAAQSHVKVSFEMSEYTGDVDALGTLRLLDAIRSCGFEKLVKFYQASTSELYGKVRMVPQNEDTPFHPRSPYGVAKLYAFWSVINYREAYGMFACNGVLFNHESPRRGRTFVTRKITRAVAEISCGGQGCMFMGNIDAKRDWGHARDYVEGMWRMLQLDQPEDFVLASNETHSVREFIEKSFEVVGIRIRWEGEGLDEVGKCSETGKVLVRVDPQYFRPAEVDLLHGDSTKAANLLSWKRKVTFEELVREMVLADIASVKNRVVDHN
ncbi:hypothetical protein JCM24511_10158 [Saitozyma sp. JCM 24511]|nr:hypothetical protein JCM24511_10158 [Saitozyma sp. JCM 24511]